MHTTWKRVVLETYPKYAISPEREITGMGAIIDKRQSQLREVSRAVNQKRRNAGDPGREYSSRKSR